MAGTESTDSERWLVLIHHFPRDPGSLRVKIWRRLQDLGALTLRKSMYVLPHTEQNLEDFQWVLRELLAAGAEAAILDAAFLAGTSDAELRALFDAAREQDYAALAGELRAARDAAGQTPPTPQQLTRFRKRLADIRAIDFFGASGREAVQFLADELEQQIHPSNAETGEIAMQATTAAELRHRVWVTRRNVHIDRIASAWLIRRWIDADARFKFVQGEGYRPSPGEVRFDMYEAEFTHEGDQCTFEVLAKRFAAGDRALGSIAEIVHDIDLKEHKYDREEEAGIRRMLAGIIASSDDDLRRIESGAVLFDSLYHAFDRQPK